MRIEERAYNDFFCDVRVKVMCRVFEEPTLDLPDGLALNHQGELNRGHVRVVVDFIVLYKKCFRYYSTWPWTEIVYVFRESDTISEINKGVKKSLIFFSNLCKSQGT